MCQVSSPVSSGLLKNGSEDFVLATVFSYLSRQGSVAFLEGGVVPTLTLYWMAAAIRRIFGATEAI